MRFEHQPVIFPAQAINQLTANETASPINQEPYISARKEVMELVDQFSTLPQSTDDLVRLTLSRINPETHGVSQDSFADMMLPLFKDIVSMSKKANEIDPQSEVYIQYPNYTYKYISPEAHRFLSRSRFLGIIPLETLDRLQHQPIISIGASVGASTLDQLVSAGAEHTLLIDNGILEPSNQPRMPIGSILHNGQTKIQTVLEQQYARNPFGEYKAISGRIVPTAEDKQSSQDVTFDEVISGNEIIIEAIDSVTTKIKLRQYIRERYQNMPLFMPTDVGIQPFISVEQGSTDPLFNQLQFNSPELIDHILHHKEAGLSAVYQMVKSHFPLEHAAEFIAIRLELIKYWSQIPTSARESGAMTTLLLLKYLQDGKIQSKNYTAADIPNNLMPYSPKDFQQINTVAQSLFNLP